MDKILVTGGAGYVGSICASQLLGLGHEVIIVDDLSTGHEAAIPKGATFHQVNIGDQAGLEKILKSNKIEAVFHFAAKALIAESVTNPAFFYETNMHGAFTMAEALRKAGVRKFVFSSTAAVYGNTSVSPIPEDHPKSPVNSYGESKLAFENMLRWYSSAYGWSVVAFRYFNASGATKDLGEMHEPETHIIPLLLQVASGRRTEFVVYGKDYETPDGSCLRDYVHVLDIADAHIAALAGMQKPGFDAYNIGTGVSHSVLEVCKVAEEVTGKALSIRFGARRPGDPAILCASPTKIMKDFGWKPAHSELRSIVQSAWEWEKKEEQRKLAPALNANS
jgi:UDP-glucose 4-epimerase